MNIFEGSRRISKVAMVAGSLIFITLCFWNGYFQHDFYALFWLLPFLAAFWALTWAIGWIVRGFMGIPWGKDSKELNPKACVGPTEAQLTPKPEFKRIPIQSSHRS